MLVIALLLKPEVSFGDLLAVVVPVLIGIALWMVKLYRERHPFRVSFPVVLPDGPKELEYNRGLKRSYEMPRAQSPTTIYVVVYSRFRGPFDWFRLVFGTLHRDPIKWRPWRVWRNELRGVINIKDVRVRRKRGVAFAVNVDTTDPSDTDVQVTNSIDWAADEPMELEVDVYANSEWKGYLSFYSLQGPIAKRRPCRRRFTVTP